jgi:hypothetical protein
LSLLKYAMLVSKKKATYRDKGNWRRSLPESCQNMTCIPSFQPRKNLARETVDRLVARKKGSAPASAHVSAVLIIVRRRANGKGRMLKDQYSTKMGLSGLANSPWDITGGGIGTPAAWLGAGSWRSDSGCLVDGRRSMRIHWNSTID